MSILTDMKNLSIEELYWLVKFGKSHKKANFYELRETGFNNLPAPVFFLSTGRCGTAWFSKLIAKDKSVKLFHNPTPNLTVQGKLAYHSSRNAKPKSESVELFLKEIFFAGRESHIRFSYKSQKRYIETNNGITFFAPVLAKIFPEAKFVHLIRPPLEFIVSGLKRNYYSGSAEDIKRISTDIIFDEWKSTSQITKIAWLWHATNKFIMDFEKQYPCRIMVFPFQELNLKNVRSVIDFLELSIADKSIQKEISKPVNVQKAGKAKSYENWGLKQKEEVRNLCRDIVNELNVKYE